MGLKDRIANWFGYYRPDKIIRSYESAKISRLNWGWLAPVSSQDRETYQSLVTLRARSRESVRNNDYAKKFLAMVHSNVVGSAGIKFKPNVKDSLGETDKTANDELRNAWNAWGEKGICTVDGKLSWLDLQRMVISSIARDGEILIRKIKGKQFNEFGFAVQVFEADYLAENVNQPGNYGKPLIRQGVEYNAYDRPVAYHIRKQHPGDYLMHRDQSEIVRIPAEEIIHPFIMDRAGQSRGVPWMHSAMRRLDQIGEYEEAEIVAARLGASSCGFFKKNPTSMAQMIPDARDDRGQMLMDAVPGTFRELPPGIELDQFRVDHPTTQYAEFVKATLRGAAAGLLVSYANLACDLRDVNYSSIRAGLLEERDLWRVVQTWFIEQFYKPIYKEWLLWALINGQIPYPFANYDRFLNVKWQPRGWMWVDPLKDVDASLTEIDNGLNTRTKVLAENYGEDYEDILAQLAEEKELAEEYGVEFEKDKPKQVVIGGDGNGTGNQNNDNGDSGNAGKHITIANARSQI